jgi:hypothetical protein
MLKLRDDYGLRDVFGIVTNYREWRIVWLPDTDQVAADTTLRNVQHEHLIDDVQEDINRYEFPN